MIPEERPASQDVGIRRIVKQDNNMRDSSISKPKAALAIGACDRRVVRGHHRRGLQVDLGLAVYKSGRYRAGVGREGKLPWAHNPELRSKPSTAERGVAAELAKAPISVEVTYPKVLLCIGLNEYNSIRTYACCAGADPINNGRLRYIGERARASIKEEKVIP